MKKIIFILFFTLNFIDAQVSVHIDSATDLLVEEADIFVSGDLYLEGDIVSKSSRVVFNGVGNQYINQTTQKSLDHLKVSKASGSLYLTDSLRVVDSLSMARGKIIAMDGAPLIMLSAAVCVGGDSVTFVEGPLAKVYAVSALADSFTFPAGDNLDYRPVTVSFATVTDDSILVTVEQINGDTKMFGSNYNGVDKVSSVRYWHILQHGNGSFTDARVTLSYDSLTTNDGVGIASELRVVQLDTSITWVWNNIGGSGSADYKGTITSNVFSGFQPGYFTFGDASGGGDIALPVFLTLFELSEKRGEVALNWKTSSEINNLYWLVQRKDVEADTTSGNDFETIAKLDGQGTTSNETDYALADNSTISGKEYAYRLVDVSYSGRKHFHDVQSILVGLPNKYKLFQNYPNPFNPNTTILYDLPFNSEVRVDVFNILGQSVASLVNENQRAGYYKIVWDGRNKRGTHVASGMYILAIQATGEKEGEKRSFSKAKKMMLVK